MALFIFQPIFHFFFHRAGLELGLLGPEPAALTIEPLTCLIYLKMTIMQIKLITYQSARCKLVTEDANV